MGLDRSAFKGEEMSEMNTASTLDTVPETDQAPKVRKPRSDKGRSRKRAEGADYNFTASVPITDIVSALQDNPGDPAVVALTQQAESLRAQLDKTERALAILQE